MRDPDNSAFQPAQVRYGEFAAHLRHRCRHCHCQIDTTAAERDAFCNRKCFGGYFRTRCLTCEDPLEPKARSSNQRFCRERCRKKFHRGREHYLGRFRAELRLERGAFKSVLRSVNTNIPGASAGGPRNPIKSGVQNPVQNRSSLIAYCPPGLAGEPSRR